MAKGRPLQGWWGGAVLLIGIKSFRLPNLTWLYFCTKLYSAMPIDRLFSRDFHLQLHNFCHSFLHSTVKENVESNRSVGHFDSIGVFDSLQLFDWCQILVANYGFTSIDWFSFNTLSWSDPRIWTICCASSLTWLNLFCIFCITKPLQ